MKRLLILVSEILCILSMAGTSSARVEFPNYDTYIEEFSKDRKNCGETSLHIGQLPPGYRDYTLMGGFDLTGVSYPTSNDILHLHALGPDQGVHTVHVFPITAPWQDCSASWNNQPPYDPSLECSLTDTLNYIQNNWWIEIDVTRIVNAWLSGKPNYGVLISMTPVSPFGNQFDVLMPSLEAPEFHPYISLNGDYIGPTANFKGEPTSGPASLEVQFTDLSTFNNPEYSIWDFGDGTRAGGRDPRHTYTTPGKYTVWLMAQNSWEADRDTKPLYITVEPPNEEPICAIDKDQLNFPDTEVNDCSPTQNFTITNTGGGTLVGNVSAPGCGDFNVTNAGSFSLTANQTKTVTVAFCPKSTGDKACTIDTGTEKCKDVQCTGKGLPPSNQYVHPYRVHVESVGIDYMSYDPAHLPMGVRVGAPVSVTCVVKDATGKAIPGAEAGTSVRVFDFLFPLAQCLVPITPDGNGRFTYETSIGPSVNGNFRSLFARLDNFDDLPFLLGLNIKLNDSANLVSQQSLDLLYAELLTDAPPGYYTSIGFQGLTAKDQNGQPLYEWGKHKSELIEPTRWSDLVTENSFPFIMQMMTWYEGVVFQDVFGPHVEVREDATVKQKSEREIAFNLSPAILVQPLLAIGTYYGLCVNPVAWLNPLEASLGCGVALNSTVTFLIMDVGIAVNRVSGLVDPGWEERENWLLNAGQVYRLSNFVSLNTIPVGIVGEGVGNFEESLRKYSFKLSLDFLKAGEEAEETGNYPFVVTGFESVDNGLGFDYRYTFIYGGQEFTMKVVDPCTNMLDPCTAIDGETPTAPALHTMLSVSPNPFNPETQIAFTVEKEGLCRVEVYDLAGRKVKTLINESRASGNYAVTWHGTDEEGRVCASGAYVVRLVTGSSTLTRRIVLLK